MDEGLLKARRHWGPWGIGGNVWEASYFKKGPLRFPFKQGCVPPWFLEYFGEEENLGLF